MATHFSILAGKITWTEVPGGLHSMGHKSQIQLSDSHTHTHTHTPTWVSQVFSTIPLITSFPYIKMEITAVTRDPSDQCHLSVRDSDLAPPHVGTLGVRMPLYV